MAEKTIEELRAEHRALARAMQAGVAASLDKRDQEPKHLRVGVNAAMADTGSICRLLIAKGIITEVELYEALVEGMRREVASYEALLSHQLGVKEVTLI